MGLFDTFADSPFQIKTEGEQITLSFKPGLPVDGQGTVSWNIPTNVAGCAAAEDGRGVYTGIVVVLDTKPISADTRPDNGTIYIADNTANADLHAGDKINEALVVGAFYEKEKRSRGEDLTTSFIINDLDLKSPYYLAAYAVDFQNRFHQEGTRSYSEAYGEEEEVGQPSSQLITSDPSLTPSDGTGLTAGMIYEVEVLLNTDLPNVGSDRVVKLSVDGIDAGTYEDLLKSLNTQLAGIDNPFTSQQPPNAGQLYWKNDSSQLFTFDGTEHQLIPTTIVEATDPANVVPGTYWANSDTGIVQQYGIPLNNQWNPLNTIQFGSVNPQAPACDDYWYDGSTTRLWNGTTWCDTITYTQPTNPAEGITPACGSYWFSVESSELFIWDTNTDCWKSTAAIYWPESPTALSAGTHWFDETSQKLFIRGSGWTELPVTISADAPTTPVSNDLWFDINTDALAEWSTTSMSWVDVDVMVWPVDPASVDSCDMWWNATDDMLYVWDTTTSQWDQVASFIQAVTDPATAPYVEVGSTWANGATHSTWDGLTWGAITPITHPTDPFTPVLNDTYQNSNGEWFQYDGNTWLPLNTVDSLSDPTIIPTGVYWYDTTSNQLQVRNGVIWQPVMFSTTELYPATGTEWLNTTTCELQVWKNGVWNSKKPEASFNITPDGNIELSTIATGSSVSVMLLSPDPINAAGHHCSVGSGFASYDEFSCQHHGVCAGFAVPQATTSSEDFLFNNLAQDIRITRNTYGVDGVGKTPMYDVVGIGTDGSNDERREVMDSIRIQLGYPAVEVELTNIALNAAVQIALEHFRSRSSLAYKRGFFFIDVKRNQQRYLLTNKRIGYHKIVNVMAAYRFSSSFLSAAQGAGVYGQSVMQQLYHGGKYDLTSFFLISQYMETLEHMFATRLTYHWDEPERALDFYTTFVYNERVLLDCTLERTEQELLTDRWSKLWIERRALAEAMTMLAQIRGKYATLPGAGGGVSLNANDLLASASEIKAELEQQIDDYVVQDIEDIGQASTFVIG